MNRWLTRIFRTRRKREHGEDSVTTPSFCDHPLEKRKIVHDDERPHFGAEYCTECQSIRRTFYISQQEEN